MAKQHGSALTPMKRNKSAYPVTLGLMELLKDGPWLQQQLKMGHQMAR